MILRQPKTDHPACGDRALHYVDRMKFIIFNHASAFPLI
jgi:hypothetical protein